MRKISTMIESFDSSDNAFADLTASLRWNEAVAPAPGAIGLQSPSSQQLLVRSAIPISCRIPPNELDEPGSFFYDDSYYENDLVCLSGNSSNYGGQSSVLDSMEQETNFSVQDGPGNENFPSHSLNYIPTSSISSTAEGESSPDETSCAEIAKTLENLADIQAEPHADSYFSTKGKVSDLQRSALDAIFQITDRPSRVLVIYIASELRLHHVTVKNFFSNARRRVRRAAARLTDPERSKRENRKRKEKRRLAALSLAAGSRAAGASGHSLSKMNPNLKPSLSYKMSVFHQSNVSGCDEAQLQSAEIVSPKRRALMEKLVDKVQRSAAQRMLGHVSDTLPRTLGSTDQISVRTVPSDSSQICRTDTSSSFSDFSIPFSSTPRPGEEVFSNIVPVDIDAGPNCLHESTHRTDKTSILNYTSVSESLSGDYTKNKSFSPPWENNLLNVSLEYQPESWDVSSLS